MSPRRLILLSLSLSLLALSSTASILPDHASPHRHPSTNLPPNPSTPLHLPHLTRQQDPQSTTQEQPQPAPPPDIDSTAPQPLPVPDTPPTDTTTSDPAPDTPDGATTAVSDPASTADDPLLAQPAPDTASQGADVTTDGDTEQDDVEPLPAGMEDGNEGGMTDVAAPDGGLEDGDMDDGDADDGAEEGVVDSNDADDTVTGQSLDDDGDGEGEDGVTEVGEDEGTAEVDGDGGDVTAAEEEEGTVSQGEGVGTGEAPVSDGKVPETPTAGNETAAYLSFELNQMQEVDDGSAGFHMLPVFQNGSLVGRFADSPKIANFDAIEEEEDDRRWYNDGPYADRISFQYIFTPDSTDYAELKPKIWTEEPDSGIEPILENESLDMEAGVGQFTLLYRCEPGGSERNRVALHISITSEHSLDTMWVKVCGRGRFAHMHFGFIGGDEKLMEFNPDGTYGVEEKHILEVGPTQLSTVLSVGLEQPAWELQFKTPYLTSDSDLVSVSLRETVTGGTLSADVVHKFSILYSCAQNTARANIGFTFAIPPWDNVTAEWRKNCGGVQSQGLLIGTSGSGSYEVMQDGELNEKYNVTEDTSLERAYGVIEEIDGKTNAARFYVKNSDDAADLYIQTIALTMSNPDVLRGIIEVPFGGSGSYLSRSGGVVGRLETKSLRVRFICRKVGESLVMVTLPIQKFKNVEFGFIKHCLEPQVYHGSGFLQTAGSLLGAIFVLSICGGIGFWVYMRRRAQAGQKWTAVPTSDANP